MTQQLPQRRIGDRSVSAIGLGAMPMSVREVNDEGGGSRTIHAALDAGVTLIDTADAYSIDEDNFGHNELLIARALREYGGDTSRCWWRPRAGTPGGGRTGSSTAGPTTSARPASPRSGGSGSSGSTSTSTTGPTRRCRTTRPSAG